MWNSPEVNVGVVAEEEEEEVSGELVVSGISSTTTSLGDVEQGLVSPDGDGSRRPLQLRICLFRLLTVENLRSHKEQPWAGI